MKYLTIILILLFSCKSGDISDGKKDDRRDRDKPLSLKPSLEIKDDIMHFELEAIRNFNVEQEYLPTSEELRIVIRDTRAQVIFRSNEGMNYFQAIGEVKPIEINDTNTYYLTTKIPKGFDKGTYYIHFMIPAKPNPYQTMLEYERK